MTSYNLILGTDAGEIINGSGAADLIFASGGDDLIYPGEGHNKVYAGDGNDYILGLSGADYLSGDAGNDRIFGNGESDTLDGGTGNDVMDGGLGHDIYKVDSLEDTVIEQLSVDIDHVFSYVDNYTLTANVENLYLQSLSYVLKGTGNDLDNSIKGNEFNNVLSGLEGQDQIDGGLGNDKLDGGSGYDLLEGNSGNDTLIGGREDDLLIGGAGRDTLIGGAGKDYFYFEKPLEGIDKIKTFVAADDIFDISMAGFGGGLTEGTLKADQFRIGSSAQDSSDRFIYNKGTGALYFDSDGIGGVAQIQFAKLSTGLAMTNQNFYVLASM